MRTSRSMAGATGPARGVAWSCGRRGSVAGFTLIEMTIAAALMVIVLTAAYLCLSAGLAAQRFIDPRMEAVQTGRVALAMMAADLRCACPLSSETEFVGMKRKVGDIEAWNIDFGTHNHTPSRRGEGDFCQTSYFVDADPEDGGLVLWRRRNPRIALDPFSGGSREEIARGVRGLKFEFYDGLTWYETWGDANANARDKQRTSDESKFNLWGMPEAVRITLSLAPGIRTRKPAENRDPSLRTVPDEERAMVFQTVARIFVPASSIDGGSGSTTNRAARTGIPDGAWRLALGRDRRDGESPAMPGDRRPPWDGQYTEDRAPSRAPECRPSGGLMRPTRSIEGGA